MNSLKRWLILALIIILGLSVLIALPVYFSSEYIVDFLWFDSLGYLFYYWQRVLYRYLVFGSVTLAFFLIFFLNFWVASRFLGTTSPPESRGRASLKAYKDVFKMFRSGSMLVYTPLSVILAIPIAWPLFQKWELFLLYVFQSPSGVQDPVYHNDVSFYLFSLPIYMLLQRRLLIAFFLLFLGIVFLYWLERRVLNQQDQGMPAGAKIHLSVLLLLAIGIEAWAFILQRYELLYSSAHEPLFFGPGFVQMNTILPLIWLCIVFLAGAAISLTIFINTRKYFAVTAGFTLLFLLALGARYSDFLPEFVQKYWVRPNAVEKERPYIYNSIYSTLTAYKLSDVEVREFIPERVPREVVTQKIPDILRNIPVWDGELLNSVYEQLQELRTYYDFTTVDVSHISVNNKNQQVFLAARELNLEELAAGARNWVNDHLLYTHGYGLVMTPAGQGGGDQAMNWYLRGIPMESDIGFQIEQPGIYFGLLNNYTYVIAPNETGELDYPKGDTNVTTNYRGTGGVPFDSYFKKFLFSLYFNDRNLFFTRNDREGSRILFRRNIREQIQLITPFLLLDNDPYLAVSPKGLFWIQDAYTLSDKFPNAAMSESKAGPVNYIRNSVKIVVDAYNGSVNYYVFEPDDPIIKAYGRIYPGVFKSREEFPADLKFQVRFPQDIFNIQMGIYAKYHQTDPDVFYQQEDTWEFATTLRHADELPAKSYYVTLDLIERGEFHFLLLSPMSPKGRANLRALPFVACDDPYYGKIMVYSFPKGELVYGPSQVSALINQDTRVAEQFTLWDQLGSEVRRGKMIILPIGKMITYIQPVYLQSSAALKIPELKRLIMTQGQIVVMAPSLEEAYMGLEDRLREEFERASRRIAPPTAGPGESPRMAPPPGAPPPDRQGRPPAVREESGRGRPPMGRQEPGLEVPPSMGREEPGRGGPPMVREEPERGVPPIDREEPGREQPPPMGKEEPGRSGPPMVREEPERGAPPIDREEPESGGPPMGREAPGPEASPPDVPPGGPPVEESQPRPQ